MNLVDGKLLVQLIQLFIRFGNLVLGVECPARVQRLRDDKYTLIGVVAVFAYRFVPGIKVAHVESTVRIDINFWQESRVSNFPCFRTCHRL